MKLSRLAIAMAVLAPVTAAHAAIFYTPYGGATGVGAPPGETQITDFSDGTLGNAYTLDGFSGTAVVVQGSLSGVYAAPATSPTTQDTGYYLAVEPGTSATYTSTTKISDVSIYAGSLDAYNDVTIIGAGPGGTTQTYTGAEIAAAVNAQDNGDQTSGKSNGRLTFTFAPGTYAVTFASTSPAFEIASLATSVPEPADWALLILGMAGIGATLRYSRTRPSLLTEPAV